MTTPTYYVNDVPHIGHFYTTLISDVIARFKRLDGYQVKFTTGTDEHGQKVAETAQKHGVPVRDFVDKVSSSFRSLVRQSDFSCDDFIRTTEERHKNAVLELWNRLVDRGQIYQGTYAGFYSVRDETFYHERELVDGKAPTGATVEWLEEKGYFFRLSDWQESLLKLYEQNPRFVVPAGKLSEVLGFVKAGLRDLSISRSKAHFSWGIGVPNDPDHLIYVWVDALSNYLATLQFPDTGAEDYRNYWLSGGLHVIGKDILKFHAVYWPALLMAADLPVPGQILAHGWWLNEGEKISKSLGNVIDPLALIDEYGLENVRYFLLSEAPIGNDASFSKRMFVNRINADLANNFGNLVQRTITLIHKECSGIIPSVDLNEFDEDRLVDYAKILDTYTGFMSEYKLFEAIRVAIALSSEANEYVAKKAPWKLFVSDRKLAERVIFKLVEYVRCIAIMLQPFLPSSSAKVLDLIGLAAEKRGFDCFTLPHNSGSAVGNPEPIFARILI